MDVFVAKLLRDEEEIAFNAGSQRNWFGCGAKISSGWSGRRSPISPWRADQFDNASGLRPLLIG
jgi:hypothetical protein